MKRPPAVSLTLRTKTLAIVTLGALASAATADLIGHWAFDEGEGTTAADSSPAGNTGVLEGDPQWTTDAIRGSFLTFDGSGDVVDPSVTLPLFDLTNDFTWACWAKYDGTTRPNAVIIGNRRRSVADGGGDFSPRQFVKFTPNIFVLHTGGAATEVIDYEELGAQWRHMAVVKTGANIDYYENGVLTTTQTLDEGDVMTDAMPFYIGGQPSNPAGEFFIGSIDDVRIYDNALTAQEISDLVGAVVLPPVWSGNPLEVASVDQDVAVIGTLADFVTDPLEQGLTITKTSGPEWLSIATDGTLSGTPTGTDVGANFFDVEATNVDGTSTSTVIIRVVDPNAAEISAELYAWWPLNDGSGDTAIDISGNGSDAVITNASTGGLGVDGSAWTEDPECGTVLSFNGDNAAGAYAFGTTLPVFTLDPSSEFTWSFWAKSTVAETTDIIVGNRRDADDVQFAPREFIKFTGGGFQWDTNNVQSLAYPIATTGVWLHHSVVKSGDTLTYYRNGAELNTLTVVAAPTNPQPLFLGGQGFGERWSGSLFDVRLYNEALTPEEVFTVSTRKGLFAAIPNNAPTLSVKAMGDDLVFTWDSQTGKLYHLRSDTTLTGPTTNWPIFGGNMDIVATTPTNTLTIARPADPVHFFVIEEFDAPPVAVLSDDFESGQGGWVVGSDGDAGTVWEIGTPSNTFTPTQANSGANCFGTNIAADYALNADVWLRSPVINLTNAGSATLNLAYFLEAEPTFDFAFINVLDATDDSLIAPVGPSIDATTTDWTSLSRALPPGALGKMVKIEFRFDSDELNNSSGWYIDDVEVTVP